MRDRYGRRRRSGRRPGSGSRRSPGLCGRRCGTVRASIPCRGSGTLAQFAIRVDEHQRTAEAITREAAQTAGYSAQSFGLDGGGQPITATESDSRDQRLMVTRKRTPRSSALRSLRSAPASSSATGLRSRSRPPPPHSTCSTGQGRLGLDEGQDPAPRVGRHRRQGRGVRDPLRNGGCSTRPRRGLPDRLAGSTSLARSSRRASTNSATSSLIFASALANRGCQPSELGTPSYQHWTTIIKSAM